MSHVSCLVMFRWFILHFVGCVCARRVHARRWVLKDVYRVDRWVCVSVPNRLVGLAANMFFIFDDFQGVLIRGVREMMENCLSIFRLMSNIVRFSNGCGKDNSVRPTSSSGAVEDCFSR